MSLSKRALEILATMEPGKEYSCYDLGTSRKLMVSLRDHGKVTQSIDANARGYAKIDLGVKFKRVVKL